MIGVFLKYQEKLAETKKKCSLLLYTFVYLNSHVLTFSSTYATTHTLYVHKYVYVSVYI